VNIGAGIATLTLRLPRLRKPAFLSALVRTRHMPEGHRAVETDDFLGCELPDELSRTSQ
jgi:hypothetical protein